MQILPTIEYGKLHSKRLSYLVVSCFMISAKLSLSASVRSVILKKKSIICDYLYFMSPQDMPAPRQYHGLIGPGGPIRHQAKPIAVLDNDPLLLGHLLLGVV